MRSRALNSALRGALLLYVALTLLPLRYHAAATGLDQSWAVALNWFHVQGVIHGRDVAFTYGPLAYLTLPMPMGSNLEQGLLFQAAAWLVFCGVLGWLFLRRRIWLPLAASFTVLSVPAAGLLHDFGYAGPDFFLEGFVLLCVAASALLPGIALAVAAAITTALLLLIKWTSGLAALSALLVFAVAMLARRDARSAPVASFAAVTAPVLFAAGFLVYEPSLRSLGRELRAGYEIGAGHASIMTSPGQGNGLAMALMVLAGYAALAAVLAALREPAWTVAAAGLAPLFMEFKHSFIREPGHSEIFFCFSALLTGIVILSLPRCGRRHWPVACALALMAVPWLWRDGQRLYSFVEPPMKALRTLREASEFSKLKASLVAQSEAGLKPDRLPDEMLARIGTHTITIFPWENSYAPANALHYVPLPIFQTHSAYTVWLDNWNADFLSDPRYAPEMVLFEWAAIDDRHPLLDVPATALALYLNYEFDSASKEKLLLRKRATPLFAHRQTIGSGRLDLSRPLELPASQHPLVGRIHPRPTLYGRLLELLFREPPTVATLSAPDGRFIVARVPPRILGNGLVINFLPSDLAGFRRLMEKNEVDQPLREGVLGGRARPLLQSGADYEIDEFPGISFSVPPVEPVPDLKQMDDRGVLDSAKIETLGGQGVMNRSDRELIQVPGDIGYVTLGGWAVAPSGAKVFVEFDGKLAPVLRRPRLDIGMLFGESAAADAGLEWSSPAWKLGTATHKVRLIIVSEDRRSFQESSQTLQFKIEN